MKRILSLLLRTRMLDWLIAKLLVRHMRKNAWLWPLAVNFSRNMAGVDLALRLSVLAGMPLRIDELQGLAQLPSIGKGPLHAHVRRAIDAVDGPGDRAVHLYDAILKEVRKHV